MRYACLLSPILLGAAALAQPLPFSEPFDGKLKEGWTWLRENPDGWRVKDGSLEILIEPGNMWGTSNDAKNTLIRPIPEVKDGGVAISATVENDPTNQYEQIDLVWYYDDSHMVKIGLELVDEELSLVMGWEENDRASTVCIIPMESNAVRVRLTAKDGEMLGEYQFPGQDGWLEAGRCPVPENGAPKASIQAYQGAPGVAHWAKVRDFRMEVVE